MPSEERLPEVVQNPLSFELGQEVIDKDGKMLGKIQARFSRYILVERGGLFLKAYYVPHSAITIDANDVICCLLPSVSSTPPLAVLSAYISMCC